MATNVTNSTSVDISNSTQTLTRTAGVYASTQTVTCTGAYNAGISAGSSGYVTVPTALLSVTTKGTFDTTNYANAAINIAKHGIPFIPENGTPSGTSSSVTVVNGLPTGSNNAASDTSGAVGWDNQNGYGKHHIAYGLARSNTRCITGLSNASVTMLVGNSRSKMFFCSDGS